MRSETLALYRPLRAEIQRHLRIAPEHAERADWMAVAEILDIVQDGEVVADSSTLEMLTDAVLFALRASGDRVIDRYVAGLVDRRERAFARRIAKGTFSIWRIVGAHPQGGVWVDDALGTRKHKHLMDEALEKSASAGTLVAMRVFDAGPFLAGFGIVIPVTGVAVTMLRGVCRAGRPPDLDIIIYGHAIHGLSIEETLVQGLSPVRSDAVE
jgi:hypothetical protein